jgi:NAD dependent epimerase/dehydratase family enzyme
MAKETMLQGQKVIPKRLMDDGFQFKFTKLDDALENLLKQAN